MKTLTKIKLSSFSQIELNSRELGKILGGENCCTCACDPSKLWANVKETGNSNHANDLADDPGYGSGAFGAPKTR